MFLCLSAPKAIDYSMYLYKKWPESPKLSKLKSHQFELKTENDKVLQDEEEPPLECNGWASNVCYWCGKAEMGKKRLSYGILNYRVEKWFQNVVSCVFSSFIFRCQIYYVHFAMARDKWAADKYKRRFKKQKKMFFVSRKKLKYDSVDITMKLLLLD